jgi:membrane protease YdiL (CAAX protease family)
MRFAVILIVCVFVAAPTLMALFQPSQPLQKRIVWALAIFLSPFVLLTAVHFTPGLDGSSPDHSSPMRAFGVLLSTSAFILPWCLFAISRAGRAGQAMR